MVKRWMTDLTVVASITCCLYYPALDAAATKIGYLLSFER
jgi:hypothetical protein